MSRDSTRTSRQVWPLYLACYVLWLGVAVLGGWLIFEGRDAMFALAVWLRANPWVIRAIDQFSVVTFGLIWLVAILGVEQYFRQGVIKNRLWRRAARMLIVEVLVLGILYGVQFILG